MLMHACAHQTKNGSRNWSGNYIYLPDIFVSDYAFVTCCTIVVHFQAAKCMTEGW